MGNAEAVARHEALFQLAKYTAEKRQAASPNGKPSRVNPLYFLPAGTVLAAVVQGSAVRLATMQDPAAPGKLAAFVKCNKSEHNSTHPLSGWPSNCDAGFEGARAHVVSVPAGVIPFSPAALNYVANHDDLRVFMEEVNAYIASKAIAPEVGGFHMLACSACLKDELSWWSDTGGLICCSTCCSSLHFKCTPTGPSEFPETGYGSLWLCPECMDRLESGQLGQPAIKPALMTEAQELVKVADWRETKRDSPGKSARLKQAEAAYRLKLQQLGLQLPNWLPPLPVPPAAAAAPAPAPAPAPAAPAPAAPAPAAPAPAAPAPASAPPAVDLQRHILEPLWQLRTTLTSTVDEAAFDHKATQLLEAACHKLTAGGAAGFAALGGLSTDHSRRQLLMGIRSTAFDFDRAHPALCSARSAGLPAAASSSSSTARQPSCRLCRFCLVPVRRLC